MNNINSTNFITGIRAIAILMVFLVHSGGGGLETLSTLGKTLIFWGRYGVEIFFVISGFTIFYQFYKENYTATQFIIVRYLRISIPYYPILLLSFIFMYFKFQPPNYWMEKFNGQNIEFQNLIFHITYLGGFDLRFINTLITVEWTLYIEMLMYVFFFFLIKFKVIKFNFINTMLITICFFIIQRYINRYIKMDDLLFHWSVLKYMYMFLLGGLSFFIREKISMLDFKILNNISNFAIIFIIIIFFLNLNYIFFKDVELFFVILTFLSVIFIRDSSFLSFLINNKLFLFLGTISYSFYLWHAIILSFNIFRLEILDGSIFLNFIYAFALTVFVSYLWYLFFEKYIYKNLKRYVLQKLNKLK